VIREVQRGQVRLCVPDHADGVIREVFDEDCYRVSKIPRDSFVVDVGAHVGCFSLRCASERDCTVLAYEPNPLVFGFLTASVFASGMGHRVGRVFSAVGAENGLVPFYINSEHPAGSQLYGDEYPDVTYERVLVPCATLDSVVKVLPEDKFLVLKTDCEGAERDFLTEGCGESLRCFSLIVGEWHNYDGARYRDVLESLGFDVELRGGGVPQPVWDPSIGGGLLYARRR
jgi:FkbM family methyltransferase